MEEQYLKKFGKYRFTYFINKVKSRYNVYSELDIKDIISLLKQHNEIYLLYFSFDDLQKQ